MDVAVRIERALTQALERSQTDEAPGGLSAAMRHAVFPSGARIRPRLSIAVARACGEDAPALSDAAAVGVELLHCASLVHDDLPCFDDAPLRRGRPSVHRAYGERLAVLAGDALIVLAFEALARAAPPAPDRLAPLLLILAGATGMPAGICAGQAWECEQEIDLSGYQRAKTGALFAAATAAGAAAAGRAAAPWRPLGELLGEAYQVADDIRDVAADPAELGKPVGRDAALGRPNAVQALGMAGAIDRLDGLVARARASLPECPGRVELEAHVLAQAARLLPRHLRSAA